MPPGNRPAPPVLVPITFLLIPTLGGIETFDRPKPMKNKAYEWLKTEIGPFFDEPFEHVAVLYEGERRDMFVGETSAINGRHILNIRATEIYHANGVAQGMDMTNAPTICGPVVLFPTFIVWR